MPNQHTTKWPDRFWNKVDKSGKCWVWTGSSSSGYGNLSYGGRVQKAHRVSLMIQGVDVQGEYVCHTCDNTLCVKPDHLFVGSQSDNMTDMVDKGRHGAGRLSSPEYREWLSTRPNKSIDDTCKRGHEFSFSNTRMKKTGKGYWIRNCRKCQSLRAKKDPDLYKVKNFVRGVSNRQEVIEGIYDKLVNNNFKCWYCRNRYEQFHHVTPKSQGGVISVANIVPSCEQCNQERK